MRTLSAPLLCLLICLPAIAQNKIADIRNLRSISDIASFNLFRFRYYTFPRPDLVPSFLTFMVKNKLHNERWAVKLTPFLGEIFRASSSSVKGWIRALKGLTTDDRYILTAALGWGRPLGWKELIDEFGKKSGDDVLKITASALKKQRSPDLLNDPAGNPLNVDMMWYAFFASGDVKLVKRVLLLCGDRTASADVRKAARDTLSAAARDHNRVRAICASELPHLKGDVKEFIQDLLEKYPAENFR